MAGAMTALFALSLAGIIGLFSLKAFEIVRGRKYGAGFRERADGFAILLKEHASAVIDAIENLPLFFLRFARWFVHTSAVITAHIARHVARYAHKVADRVAGRESAVSQTQRDEGADNLDRNR